MAVKTFTTGEVLTAADTNTYLANSGLVYITATTFTASSSISVNSCFTSTYQNYLVIISCTGTANTNVNMKLRASGTDKSANYKWGSFYLDMDSGTPSVIGESSGGAITAGFRAGVMNTSGITTAFVQVGNPNGNGRTTALSQPQASEAYFRLMNSYHAEDYVADGFTIIPSSGTLTGNVRVYGYRQA